MILFLIGILSFTFNWNHILPTLISLEFVALAIFFTLSMFSPSLDFDSSSSLFYIAMAVCEGALGLGILVLHARVKGFDNLSSRNTLRW